LETLKGRDHLEDISVNERVVSRVRVAIYGVLDWLIGFIDTLFKQLKITGNYSAIVDLHT
jgi:hypothetical protein